MTNMTRVLILLVEGKRVGTVSLLPAFSKIGYTTLVANTAKEALDQLADRTPDLVVFDATAMRSNGVRSCRRIRKRLENVPLIHCRALEAPFDDTAGADVYLQMPFTSRKLLNRVKALLPAQDDEDQILRVGPITVFQGKRSVSVAGGPEHVLTPKLMGLLLEMMRNPNEVISRKQLMKNVWKTTYVGDTRTLDVHIRWIREMIELNPAKPKRLVTVRGQGYRLVI